MILKIFNETTNSFDPINIVVSQSFIDNNGNTITRYKNINDTDIISEALNTKISKDGDLINGNLQFKENFGISGSHYVQGDYYNSNIEYCSEDSNTGFFRVINSVKDVSTPNNNQSIKYFNLACDDQLTQNSKNLVTSGVLYDEIASLKDRITQLESNS